MPHLRPDHGWLEALSASAMWAANAATVSPAADSADDRCHLSVANLVTMPHAAMNGRRPWRSCASPSRRMRSASTDRCPRRSATKAQAITLAPEVEIVEVPATQVSLADAIAFYLFNAQLVTLPLDEAALIVPSETCETPAVWDWLQAHVAGNGRIRRVEAVDLRQLMANVGGAACLRLHFIVDAAKLDAIAGVIAAH